MAKKGRPTLIFLLLLLIVAGAVAFSDTNGKKPERPDEAISATANGDLLVFSAERLDSTGYSVEVLACSLKDQRVIFSAEVPRWIDSNVAFYILYPGADYLGLRWDGIRERVLNVSRDLGLSVGKVEFVKPALDKVGHSKGKFTYSAKLKAGQCTVLSFKGVFREMPKKVYLRNGKVLELPSASLSGNEEWLLTLTVPDGFNAWNAPIMVPKRLGRSEEFLRRCTEYRENLISLVGKRVTTAEELAQMDVPEEPRPPEDYCAELGANGSEVYSARLIGNSCLYSDGGYYGFDYSGKGGRVISVSFNSTGCKPAVWVAFTGRLNMFSRGVAAEDVWEGKHVRSLFGVFGNISVHNDDGDGPLMPDFEGFLVLDLVVQPG
ncbi:hypothetical protein TEU_09545 [Thermococcus eurythermalis]|uniref:Uncharacterized protein n=1 Tax=Thermococcus eurythermalis TaxID=1505907 RepID=A0A097QVP9_9EURY|nr:hypothetical protein TEU_09545 [Thermococcus eurythermalis]